MDVRASPRLQLSRWGEWVEKRDLDAELAQLLALAKQQGTLAESLAATECIAPLETQVRVLVSHSSTEPNDADA